MDHGPIRGNLPPSRLPVFDHDGTQKNEFIEDESFPSYLGDFTHINAGGLQLVHRSPYHKYLELIGKDVESEEEKEKDHFRFGRIVHMAILEPKQFLNSYVVEPEFVGVTKDGKETTSKNSKDVQRQISEWREILPEDALIMSQKEHDMLYEMIDCLMAHPEASNFFKNGKPEVTGRFTHPRTKLRGKIRLDYITNQENGDYFFFDIKSTRSAREGLFDREAKRLLYHMKMAWYYDACTLIMGREPAGCALVPIEKSMPSEVGVTWLNEGDLDKGRILYEKSLDTLVKCMETGIWPRRINHGRMLNMPEYDDEPLPEYDWGNNGRQEGITKPESVNESARLL